MITRPKVSATMGGGRIERSASPPETMVAPKAPPSSLDATNSCTTPCGTAAREAWLPKRVTVTVFLFFFCDDRDLVTGHRPRSTHTRTRAAGPQRGGAHTNSRGRFGQAQLAPGWAPYILPHQRVHVTHAAPRPQRRRRALPLTRLQSSTRLHHEPRAPRPTPRRTP